MSVRHSQKPKVISILNAQFTVCCLWILKRQTKEEQYRANYSNFFGIVRCLLNESSRLEAACCSFAATKCSLLQNVSANILHYSKRIRVVRCNTLSFGNFIRIFRISYRNRVAVSFHLEETLQLLEYLMNVRYFSCVCICVWVCMCVCVCVCVCVGRNRVAISFHEIFLHWQFSCQCIYIYTLCIYIYTYTDVKTYVWSYTGHMRHFYFFLAWYRRFGMCMYIYMYIPIFIYTCVCRYEYVYIYTHIVMHMEIYGCIYMDVYTCIYICI